MKKIMNSDTIVKKTYAKRKLTLKSINFSPIFFKPFDIIINLRQFLRPISNCENLFQKLRIFFWGGWSLVLKSSSFPWSFERRCRKSGLRKVRAMETETEMYIAKENQGWGIVKCFFTRGIVKFWERKEGKVMSNFSFLFWGQSENFGRERENEKEKWKDVCLLTIFLLIKIIF